MVVDDVGRVIRINAPEWFQLPAFIALLQRGTAPEQRQRLATFHRHGDEPNSWSDVFVPFDAYPIDKDSEGRERWDAEGSDICNSEELQDVWREIISIARERNITSGILWISNLGF